MEEEAAVAAAAVSDGVGVERLCRLCAAITTHPNQRVDIFAVDGLADKIEACLPMHVHRNSLLPDTLCTACNERITTFFSFRKRALETVRVLEENFHVARTCFVDGGFRIPRRDASTATENTIGERSQFEVWRNRQLHAFHYDAPSDLVEDDTQKAALGNCSVEMDRAKLLLETGSSQLVEYDSSDGETEPVKTALKSTTTTIRNKLYFDDKVNDIISEIVERKSTKRKLEALFDEGPSNHYETGESGAEERRSKMARLEEGNNRRKKRPPMKRTVTINITTDDASGGANCGGSYIDAIAGNLASKSQFQHQHQQRPDLEVVPEMAVDEPPSIAVALPQVCLLCDQQFGKGAALAQHVFETHGIDMAQVLSSEPIPEGMTRPILPPFTLQGLQDYANSIGNLQMQREQKPSVTTSPMEKKKKLPELVKITDLKSKRESMGKCTKDREEEDSEKRHIDLDFGFSHSTESKQQQPSSDNDAPPTLTASYVCPLCPASLTNKTDLYAHLRLRHANLAKLICGLCMHIASSLQTLQEHLEACQKSHALGGYFVCDVCKYAEDNQKQLENHVLVHDFLMADCKKDGKIFDPSDFVGTNPACDPKVYQCGECGASLSSFKEYSSHKRSEHSIFHCDLCGKSYGRNSHLWKHVNRVHKGHPSVTCQFCYKTSASKYHLLQHFNKIHTQKSGGSGLGGTPQSTPSGAGKNGDVSFLLPDEEEDFMSKKFEGFDFQSVRQSFMRAEMEAEKMREEATGGKRVRIAEYRDLSTLKMPTVPPKELDATSKVYTNIITNYTPPTNDGDYKCPKCLKGFFKRSLLKKHKKNCRPRLQKDLLTRCKSCSRIFKDRQSLAKHLVNYHSEYSCEICAEKVQSKCEIVSHLRFTHPGCRLVCPECDNVLRTDESLRAHLKDHDNSFACQFCGDCLQSKIKLKMHILSLHRKILSLSCGLCLKLFENQHILRDHVRMMHREALQPLTSCTVCGKNYGSKWKTYDHLNKSHGRVFRACKVCLEVFNNETELGNHVETAHAKSMKKYALDLSFALKPPKSKQDLLLGAVSGMASQDDDFDDDSDLSGGGAPASGDYHQKSILEKHLVGGYQLSMNNNTNKKKQNGLSATPSSVSSKKQRLKDHYGEELINSSKRTVYVNSNEPSKCDICHKNWPAKKHLWQHYIRCHKSVAAMVCGICLATNSSYEQLQYHLHREHPLLLHGKGFGSNFICRICGRYHNASSKLKLHMAIHIKFDWSLLDRLNLNNGETPLAVPKQETHLEEKVKLEDSEVNYESMIEQVECSTNSSNSSEEGDTEDDDDEEGDGEVEVEDGEGEVLDEGEVEEGEEATTDLEEEDDEEEDDDDDEEDDGEDEEGEEEGEAAVDEGVEADDDEGEYVEDSKSEPADDDEAEAEDDEEEEEEVEDEEDVVYEQADDNEYETVVEEVVNHEDMEVYETDEVLPQTAEKNAGDVEYIEEDDEEDDDEEPEALDDDDDEEEEEEEEDVPPRIIHKQHVLGKDDHAEVIPIDDEEPEEPEEGEDEEDTNSSTPRTYEEEDVEGEEVEPDEDDDDDQDDDMVDTAVKSIAYDEADLLQSDDVAEEYEVQSTATSGSNQHEIQSAVDSIL